MLTDQLEAVERASRGRGQEAPDLALLTDGLRAEREQGITIDVAYRYFATPRAPVHPRRHARATCSTPATWSPAPPPPSWPCVLVDARNGVVEQTRRHAAVAALLRVPHVVLAVNKMDLVDYAEPSSPRSRRVHRLRRPPRRARTPRDPDLGAPGDNVVTRSAHAWYGGPTVLEHLETVAVSPTGRLPDPLPGAVRDPAAVRRAAPWAARHRR